MEGKEKPLSGPGKGPTKDDFLRKTAELIKTISTAMLTTRHGDELYSRPMVVQDRDFDGTMYFLTSSKTGKCDDLQDHPHVNVAFAKPSVNSFVSVAGRAQLVDDRDLIGELWHTFDTVYFPSGKDDPDIRLIRVDADSIEYWDSPSSSIVQTYRMIKTALTGDWDAMGEHERRALPA